MRPLRAIFLVYLTLLLAWFVPAHTRGQMTMPHDQTAASCCSSHEQTPPQQPATPTQKDKANCAVCFWAAGILPEVAVMFVVRPIDRAMIEAFDAIAQCAAWFIPAESLPRGPPAPVG